MLEDRLIDDSKEPSMGGDAKGSNTIASVLRPAAS